MIHCSYPTETCSDPKFLEKEWGISLFLPLGEDDLFGMSRIMLALFFYMKCSLFP